MYVRRVNDTDMESEEESAIAVTGRIISGRETGFSVGAGHFLNNPLPAGAYSALDRGNFPLIPNRYNNNDNEDGSGGDSSVENSEDGGGGRGRRKRSRGGGRGRTTRRRPQSRTTISLDGNDADATGDEDDEEPEYYYVPCDDIEEVIRELGVPCAQHKCFGCRFVGQYKIAKIPDVRLQEVFRTMAEGIGITWPPALAVEVSLKYEAVRKVINASRGDKDPLPKWSPASILNHWYNHTLDPQILQWLYMMFCNWTIHKIRATSLIKRSRFDGHEIHDRDQFGIMQQAMRMVSFLGSKDTRKMAFFHEGAMIDNKSVSNGGLSITGKPVYNFFNNKKKKIRHPNAIQYG